MIIPDTQASTQGVKKRNRSRSKAERLRDKEARDEEKVSDLYHLYWSLSDAARDFIEFAHLPVPEYGDISLYNRSVNQRIVTIGNNPAPKKSEKSDRLTGAKAGIITAKLVYCRNEKVPKEIEEVILDSGHDYFLESTGHAYFKTYSKVGRSLSAGYYDDGDGGVHNFMVHIDLCPFSTTVRWGQIPANIREEFISKSNLLSRLQYLKPSIVMIGI